MVMAHPRPGAAVEGEALARIGREIQRAAMAIEVARASRRDAQTMTPTMERLRHGQSVEIYDGAVQEAGLVGHRIVEACLLDALRERGVLGRGEEALIRHSAGMWLRGLFHDSGLERTAFMRVEGVRSGGDPTGAPIFERSYGASRSLAIYQAVMSAMERRDLYGADVHGRAASGMSARQKRRASHAVREISCWDRWPTAFNAEEVRRAFDRLAAMEGAVAVDEDAISD